MRPLRYVGRHRNAGYGYSLVNRVRREVSNFVGFKLRAYRLAYLIDFDRDRYLEEYLEVGDWPEADASSSMVGWSGGAGSPRDPSR